MLVVMFALVASLRVGIVSGLFAVEIDVVGAVWDSPGAALVDISAVETVCHHLRPLMN